MGDEFLTVDGVLEPGDELTLLVLVIIDRHLNAQFREMKPVCERLIARIAKHQDRAAPWWAFVGYVYGRARGWLPPRMTACLIEELDDSTLFEFDQQNSIGGWPPSSTATTSKPTPPADEHSAHETAKHSPTTS